MLFHKITDGSRLLGFISIDSTIRGTARGGLRIAADLSEEEIRSASHAMTLKYGLLGLPQGGAKAGVIGDADAPASERRRLLREFASAARSLLSGQTYIPDADLGTSAADIRSMMESIGVKPRPRDWRPRRSGEHTARSCLASALAILGRGDGSLEGRRVAIEGFGSVGSALARLLSIRGAKVVAISTSRGAIHHPDGLDVEPLVRRAAEVGSRVVETGPGAIEKEALLELPVDVLFPCARSRSIHDGNVARVAAQAVCAGANDPVSPDAERVLLERGTPYPPDFLSNCGGVLGGTLEFAGVRPQRAAELIETWVQRRVSDLLEEADRVGATPREIAEANALERHARVSRQAEHPNFGQRLADLGVEAYRRGWIPTALVGLVAPKYIARGWHK